MREISRESYRPGVLTGYLAPELSHENSLAKSRASSRAKQFNNGNLAKSRAELSHEKLAKFSRKAI